MPISMNNNLQHTPRKEPESSPAAFRIMFVLRGGRGFAHYLAQRLAQHALGVWPWAYLIPSESTPGIAPDGGDKDIFVHITAVQQAGLDRLDEGDKVEFEIVEDKGKSKADQLKKI